MTWAKSSELLVKHHQELMHKYDCERKQMFGFQVFFVNNNMFSGIYEEGFTLRLSPQDRELIGKNIDFLVTPQEFVLIQHNLTKS